MESHKIHVPNHHPETHGDLGIPHKAPYISAGSASELQTKALESLLSQGPWKGRGNLLDRRLSWTTVKCATHQHHAMERHHVNGNIMCYLRSPKNPTFLSEMWLPNCSVENTKHWSKNRLGRQILIRKNQEIPVSSKGLAGKSPQKTIVFDGKIVKRPGELASHVSWHQVMQWIQIHILRSEHFTTNGSPLLSFAKFHSKSLRKFWATAHIGSILCRLWVIPCYARVNGIATSKHTACVKEFGSPWVTQIFKVSLAASPSHPWNF